MDIKYCFKTVIFTWKIIFKAFAIQQASFCMPKKYMDLHKNRKYVPLFVIHKINQKEIKSTKDLGTIVLKWS